MGSDFGGKPQLYLWFYAWETKLLHYTTGKDICQRLSSLAALSQFVQKEIPCLSRQNAFAL